ncbi:TPA: hypothetical protein HLZ17_08390 [Escherichia coli]|nr:hypothetical protein [Escherichia coli]
MSRVNHLSSLSLLAVLVLAGCSSQAPQPLKKGEKAIDVASVVRAEDACERERPRCLGERSRHHV